MLTMTRLKRLTRREHSSGIQTSTRTMTMRTRKQQTACSRTSERLTKSCKTRRRGAGTIRELTWKSCKAEGVAVAIWTPMIYSRCSSLVAVVPSVDTVAMDTVLVVKPFRLGLVEEEVASEEILC